MCSFALSGGSGKRQKISQYLVWPPFVSHSATYFLHIQLIRLLFAVRGMLAQSFSMTDQNWWILARIGRCCCICWSRASQTSWMGHMSGEYASHTRTGMFLASRNCVQIHSYARPWMIMLNMRWWSWRNGTTMGVRILSRYACAFNMLSIKCTGVWSITYCCPYHNSTTTMGHLIQKIDISNYPHTPHMLPAIRAKQ